MVYIELNKGIQSCEFHKGLLALRHSQRSGGIAVSQADALGTWEKKVTILLRDRASAARFETPGV